MCLSSTCILGINRLGKGMTQDRDPWNQKYVLLCGLKVNLHHIYISILYFAYTLAFDVIDLFRIKKTASGALTHLTRIKTFSLYEWDCEQECNAVRESSFKSASQSHSHLGKNWVWRADLITNAHTHIKYPPPREISIKRERFGSLGKCIIQLVMVTRRSLFNIIKISLTIDI